MAIINVTLNPNDAGTGHSLSSDNLTDTVASASNIRATDGRSSGKWYWEVKYTSGNAALAMGIADIRYPISSTVWNFNSGDGIYLRGYYGVGGPRIPENTAYGSAWAINDVIGISLDMDNGLLEFYKNGVSMGVSHTNLKSLGSVFPYFRSINTASKTFMVNFGASPFAYSIPSGYQGYANVPINKFLISSEDEYYSVIPEAYATESAIPVMTSNTNPSGRAFSSSEITPAYRAFDGTSSNSQSSGSIGYVGYEFPVDKKIGKYYIQSFVSSSNNIQLPKDWTFEGSNDGSKWTILDTQVNQVWNTVSVDKEYAINISNVDSFKMYRLNWTSNSGASVTGVPELKMVEYTTLKLIVLLDQSEQSFFNHGISKNTTIGITTKITERIYIVQYSSPLGSGKVFKQKIDTSKTPIKKASIT